MVINSISGTIYAFAKQIGSSKEVGGTGDTPETDEVEVLSRPDADIEADLRAFIEVLEIIVNTELRIEGVVSGCGFEGVTEETQDLIAREEANWVRRDCRPANRRRISFSDVMETVIASIGQRLSRNRDLRRALNYTSYNINDIEGSTAWMYALAANMEPVETLISQHAEGSPTGNRLRDLRVLLLALGAAREATSDIGAIVTRMGGEETPSWERYFEIENQLATRFCQQPEPRRFRFALGFTGLQRSREGINGVIEQLFGELSADAQQRITAANTSEDLITDLVNHFTSIEPAGSIPQGEARTIEISGPFTAFNANTTVIAPVDSGVTIQSVTYDESTGNIRVVVNVAEDATSGEVPLNINREDIVRCRGDEGAETTQLAPLTVRINVTGQTEPPPPPCEIPLDVQQALRESDHNLIYRLGGPLSWAERVNRWAQRYGISLFTELRAGGHYRQTPLHIVDLISERSSDANFGASAGIQADMRVRNSSYHFVPGARVDGDYTGFFGVGDRPQTGGFRGGLTLYGYDASRGRIPYFGLSAFYSGAYTTGDGNQPNPEGQHFQLRFNLGEQLTRWLALEAGVDFGVGSYGESRAADQIEVNPHNWQQIVWRAGAAFTAGPTTIVAGYEGRSEGREQVQLSGAEGPMVNVYGHGGYAAILLERGRHAFELAANIVSLGATDVSTLGFDNLRGGASARYRLTRPGGRHFDLDIAASYQREDLITASGTSDTVRFSPSFRNILSNGDYGISFSVEPYVGYQWLNFEEGFGLPTESGGVMAGLQLTLRFGAGDREVRRFIDQFDPDASPLRRSMREVQLQTESMPLSEGEMFDDALIIAVTESAPGRINMEGVNRLLLAWKTGLLGDDYSFDPSRLPEDLYAAIEAADRQPNQAGRYGYVPEQGETVSEGDVDPMPFRIGAYVESHRSGNPTDMNDSQLRQYHRGFNVLSPRERAVLNAYVARREMIAQGTHVAAPTDGTWLARRVMTSVERIVTSNSPQTESLEASINSFVTEQIATDMSNRFGIDNFAQALRTELVEARVVGPAVMALVRWQLLQIHGLNDEDRTNIMQMTCLDRATVDILGALSMGRSLEIEFVRQCIGGICLDASSRSEQSEETVEELPAELVEGEIGSEDVDMVFDETNEEYDEQTILILNNEGTEGTEEEVVEDQD